MGVLEASAVPVHLMCLGRTRLTRAVQLSPTAAGRFLVPHPGWLGCWRYLRLSPLQCIFPRLFALASVKLYVYVVAIPILSVICLRCVWLPHDPDCSPFGPVMIRYIDSFQQQLCLAGLICCLSVFL